MGLSYNPSIVVDGLQYALDVANPKCYSGSGNTTFDLTGRVLPGALTNGPTYNSNLGGFLSFDGTNDYLAVPDSNLLDLGANFTISAWIKLNDLTTAQQSIFNSLDVTINSVTKGIALVWWRDNLYGVNAKSLMIQYGMNGWAWNVYSSDANTINDLNIHHVVVTVSAANTNNPTVLFYLDGVLKTTTWWGQSTKAAINYSSNTSALRVGHLYTPGDPSYANAFANMNVYNLQVYKKALSAAEILQNYNATKSRFLVSDNIVTNGLLLNYDLSNSNCYPGTGASIFNIANSDNNGNLISSPTFIKTNGGSLSFNGSSYITRGSALNTGQNFSVTAWIYPTSLSQRNAIVGNGYPYSTDNGWLFNICNNNFGLYQALMMSIGQDNVLVISNSYVFQLNKWSHVSCSVSGGGSSVKFYVNGVETSYGFTTGSGRTISYSNNEFHIGMRHSTTAERFGGNISQVQIYNTTLTAQEILQNYNATKSRYINILPPVNDSLVLNLDAGNRASYAGTGTTWFDLTSFGAKATLINSPVFAGSGTSTYFSFDGTDDYMTLPSSNNWAVAQTATIEMWVYAENTNTNARLWCVTNNGTSLDAYIKSDTTLGLHGETCTVSSFPMSQWVHLVVVYTSGTISVYFNGVSKTVNGTTTGYNISQTGTLYIGQYAGGGSYYHKGRIATFRIYKGKALTSTEILQNFNSVRSRYNI